MRDFASCYNQQAVKVSDSTCSGSGNASSSRDPSVQRSVTCSYRAKLSTRKEFLIRVTWPNSLIGQGFSLGVEEEYHHPSQHHRPPHKVVDDSAATNSLLLRKKKGCRSYVSGDSAVEVYWDISSARYDAGPEPVGGFYVVVVVDAELGLRLGDMTSTAHDMINKWQLDARCRPVAAECSMISRREQVVGSTVYSTKSRFGDGGRYHEIQIQCSGGGGEGRDAEASELWVCVDRKRVVHVRRLKWNFRGNQTIFVDGLPVDMMWDVHDWWFSDASGFAALMFRARSALENRLWLEAEAAAQKEVQEGGKSGFSLLIHAFKRSPWQQQALGTAT